MPEIKHIEIPVITRRGVRLVAKEYGFGCKHPKCPKVWDTQDEAADCYLTHEAVLPSGVYVKSK